MTIRVLRSDTFVRTLEDRYGIDLHARADMKLGNLLRSRGFKSWSQFLRAYRGKAATHARKRRLFISFHAEDRHHVAGFRLMIRNSRVDLSVFNRSLGQPINSEQGRYVRSRIKPLISDCEVLLCLVGDGTAWREWVEWEINTAAELRKGVCGVRIKGSRGRTPPALTALGVKVSQWSVPNIVAVIEQAAARRT